MDKSYKDYLEAIEGLKSLSPKVLEEYFELQVDNLTKQEIFILIMQVLRDGLDAIIENNPVINGSDDLIRVRADIKKFSSIVNDTTSNSYNKINLKACFDKINNWINMHSQEIDLKNWLG